MSIQNVIAEIVNGIPRGYIFDSHYVIRQLIKRDYNAYLAFVCRFQPNTVTGGSVDGQLAQEITPIAKQGIVEKLEGFESWSETVTGNPCECACWRKIA